MEVINIIKDKCTGCTMCQGQCPFGAIIINNDKAEITEDCILCGSCVEACKFNAIDFKRSNDGKKACESDSGVWVFAEQQSSRIKSVTYELLGEAAKLSSSLNVKVSAVLFGSKISEAADNLIRYGADEVFVIDHPMLNQINEEIYPDLFVQLVQKYKPQIVLIGATSFGRSLAPRIASRLNTGLTADCTKLEIEPETGLLLQTRPAFGGNLMATILCPRHRPQMATVRPKVMKALDPDDSRRGTIIYPEVHFPTELKNSILNVLLSASEESNISEADIIISAGRGIGNPKNLQLIKELAHVLGAGVGASRAVVDSGWIEYSQQIGQTGKTVAPKVYIACGISGAIQHLAGISSSSYVIAINKDPEAPIFRIANLGIVGDCLEIVPALTEELKKKKGNETV